MNIAPARRAAGGARTPLLWIGTALTIVAGYVLLARGGTTAPALLLVVGYVLLAPLAIRGSAERDDDRNARDTPPYGWAALVALAVFSLYAATLAPSTAMWDTSEYMAAAKVLGIPHPPGNPLFVMIAYLFGTLPIAADFRGPHQSARGRGERGVGRDLVSRRARGDVEAVHGAMGAPRRGGRVHAGRRDELYGVEPVGGEREGIHPVPAAAHRRRVARDSMEPQAGGCGRGPSAARDRLPARARLYDPSGGAARGALRRRGGAAVRAEVVPPPAADRAGGCVGRARAVALRVRARAIGEPSRAQRGRAVGVRLGFRDGLHAEPRHARAPAIADHARAVRQARPLRAPGAVRRAARHVVAVLHVAMVSRSARGSPGGAGRDRIPRAAARIARRRAAHARARPADVRDDRGARVHADRRARVLSELQVRIHAGARARVRAVAREVRDRDYFFLWSFSCLGVWSGLGIARCWRLLAGRVRAGRARSLLAMPVLAVALVPLALNARAASRAGQTFTPSSRAISSTPSRRTRSSSRTATTTPFHSGTRRKWKGTGATWW